VRRLGVLGAATPAWSLAPLGDWIDDYNRQAPHSALGMRSPADYRAVASAMTSPPKTTAAQN